MKAIYLGVKADWPETFFWKDRPDLATAVEVRLNDIWSKLLQRCKRLGSLRVAWGVPSHMPIIVSTIMPDPYIDITHPLKYLRKIKILNPDFFTTIEVPIYDDDKGDLLQRKFEDYYYQLVLFKEHFPCDKIIVLVPGRNREETLYCVSIAYALGYRRFGIPCADSLQRDPRFSISQIHRDLKILKKYAKATYLFGITSPRNLEEFSYVDYIVTRGWYHTTMKFKQELTHYGSVKVPLQPKIKAGQQIISSNGILPANLEELDRKRRILLKNNALRGISVLFSKLQSISKQQSLEVYQKWPAKAEADSEVAIAPTLTPVQAEWQEIHG